MFSSRPHLLIEEGATNAPDSSTHQHFEPRDLRESRGSRAFFAGVLHVARLKRPPPAISKSRISSVCSLKWPLLYGAKCRSARNRREKCQNRKQGGGGQKPPPKVTRSVRHTSDKRSSVLTPYSDRHTAHPP